MLAWIKALTLSLVAVFAPVKTVILTAFVLAVADLILGLIAAHRRGEKISSKGIGRTVTKMTIYEIAILLAFLVQNYMIDDALPAVKIIGGLIGTVELKSILENLDTISGNSLFKTLIEKLGSQSNKDSNEKAPEEDDK